MLSSSMRQTRKKGCPYGHSDGRQSITGIAISSGHLSIVCLIVILVSTQASAQQPAFRYNYCQNDYGNYTTNSAYWENLHVVSSGFRSDNSNGKGFFNFSIGQSIDKVYVTGLCRGDIDPNACRICLVNSSFTLSRVCPVQKEAILGSDECMLRYSNHSLTGHMETHPRFYLWDQKNVSSNYTDSFFRDLRTLMTSLKNEAAGGGALRKYASGNAGGSQFGTIYALAQCSPDLQMVECNDCLDEAFGDVYQNYGPVGGRVVTPSCNFRYELYPFYESSNDHPPRAAPQPELLERRERKSSTFGAGAAVVTSASVVLILSIGVYSRVKKRNNRAKAAEEEEAGRNEGRPCLDFDTIRFATKNFSEKNVIRETEISVIFKGTLPNGQDISVNWFRCIKHLSNDFLQNSLQQHVNNKIHHRNIVTLQDFHLVGHRSYISIHEFLPYHLDRLIFGPENMFLEWNTRRNIIRGIACGLQYLHEESPFTFTGFIGISASQILLDESFTPKISRIWNIPCQENKGYSDPDEPSASAYPAKHDVFSFGVLLLEIVSGKRIGCFCDQEHAKAFLISARISWREEWAFVDLVDPQIKDSGCVSEIMRFIQIGLLCVQRASARPTLDSVVLMLNTNSESSLPSEENRAEVLSDDDSNSGFASASEMSLSPLYEINYPEIVSHHVESDIQYRLKNRILTSFVYLNRKLLSWRSFLATYRRR